MSYSRVQTKNGPSSWTAAVQNLAPSPRGHSFDYTARPVAISATASFADAPAIRSRPMEQTSPRFDPRHAVGRMGRWQIITKHSAFTVFVKNSTQVRSVAKALLATSPQWRTASQRSNSFHSRLERCDLRHVRYNPPARPYPANHESFCQLSSHVPSPHFRSGQPSPTSSTRFASEAARAPQTHDPECPQVHHTAKNVIDRKARHARQDPGPKDCWASAGHSRNVGEVRPRRPGHDHRSRHRSAISAPREDRRRPPGDDPAGACRDGGPLQRRTRRPA